MGRKRRGQEGQGVKRQERGEYQEDLCEAFGRTVSRLNKGKRSKREKDQHWRSSKQEKGGRNKKRV